MFSWDCIHRFTTFYSRIQTEVITSSWKIASANKTWARAAVASLEGLKINFHLREENSLDQSVTYYSAFACYTLPRIILIWGNECCDLSQWKKKSVSTPKNTRGRKGSSLDILIYGGHWQWDKQNCIHQSQTLAFNIQASSRKSHLNN